jgi:hypothetical protein
VFGRSTITAVQVDGGGSGDTVENNIVADTLDGTKLTCPTSSAFVSGLEVGSDATSGTVANYNDIDPASLAVRSVLSLLRTPVNVRAPAPEPVRRAPPKHGGLLASAVLSPISGKRPADCGSAEQ